MAITDAAVVPPMTAVPMICRATAPAPEEKARGSTPSRKAKDVIRIGLRRNRAPSSAAASRAIPRSPCLRELNDEDCILCSKTDEDDETNLGVDVVYPAAQPYRGEGPEYGDGCTEKHANRQRPALVQGCEDEKNTNQRKTEDGRPGPFRAFFPGSSCRYSRGLFRRASSVELLPRGPHYLSGAVAGFADDVDLGRTIKIVAHRKFGPGRLSIVVSAESGTGSPLSLDT